jgi:hypothetical protein
MVELRCAQLNQWKASRHGVKYICMDNVGKTLTLQEQSDSSNWMLGIKFECRACNMLQQNHLAELGSWIIVQQLQTIPRILCSH